MRRLLVTIVTLAWSLWFGGTLMLFIAVASLFETFATDHATAGRAASSIFLRFNRYQLALAAITLLATFAWRVIQQHKGITTLFTFLALATLAAVASAGWISPHIEAMRLNHQTHTEAFNRLHGISMMTFCAQAVLLLLAGATLPWIERDSDKSSKADRV